VKSVVPPYLYLFVSKAFFRISVVHGAPIT
jgi:hypothetical protein